MSREFTLRHSQTPRDFGLTVQVNAETPWPFVQLSYPQVNYFYYPTVKIVEGNYIHPT